MARDKTAFRVANGQAPLTIAIKSAKKPTTVFWGGLNRLINIRALVWSYRRYLAFFPL